MPIVSTPPQPIESSYGFHEYRVLASYREPRLFRTSAEILVTGIVEQAFRPSFNFAAGVQAQVGKRLSRRCTPHRGVLVPAHDDCSISEPRRTMRRG